VTSTSHDEGVALLECLAGLFGCIDQFGASLPDQRRPDVLRFDYSTRLLFVGEAKASESFSDAAAVSRLRAYFPWLHAHWARGQRPAVLGICFGHEEDGNGWLQRTLDLAREVGLPAPTIRTAGLGSCGVILLWW